MPDINPVLAPAATRRMSYSDLVDWRMRVPSTQGTDALHELWVDEDGCTAIYVIKPESGPIGALQQWAATQYDRPSWDLPSTAEGSATYRVQMAAERWVAQQAHIEVLAEMGEEL